MVAMVLAAAVQVGTGGAQPAGGTLPAEVPVPGLVLHVAAGAADGGDGSAGAPFATLEGARDAIRVLKQRGPLPAGGVWVEVAGGAEYRLRQTFQLGAEDSGEPGAPICYCGGGGPAGGWPTISGGVALGRFEKVSDPALLARLPEEARGRVWQTSLREEGIGEVPPVRLGGFASGRGFGSAPAVRLFAGELELPLARWPNAPATLAVETLAEDDGHQIHGLRGSKTGRFTCASERLARWVADPDIVLHGYWFWDWAESRELVKAIDPAKREITLEAPFHTYGYRAGQPFYATNLFSEIDQPGEWYLDRRTLTLFLLPPEGSGDPASGGGPAGVTLAVSGMPAVVAESVGHVRFRGLAWDAAAGDGIRLRDCRQVVIEGCRLARLGGEAVVIEGGSGCGVVSCDVLLAGRGGIKLAGGDRKSLAPGGHYVTNCHLHHLSCVDPTYTPAVLVDGVGQVVAHNRIHDLPSSAIRLGGNEHRVEFNEVARVVLESDDQGAVDMWGDPTARGNLFRYNSWRDIGPGAEGAQPKLGRAAIRFDDAISGQLVEHNLFQRCGGGGHGFGAIQIHGGRDHLVRNNLFEDCTAAVTFSPWPLERWREFVRDKFPAPGLDTGLYLARYPALAGLAESANLSEFAGNLARGCGVFLRQPPPGTAERDNLVEAAGGGEPAEAQRRAGIDPALAARIGLYQDPWRRGPECALGAAGQP